MLRRLCSQLTVPSSTVQRTTSTAAAVTATEGCLKDLDYDTLYNTISAQANVSPQGPYKFLLLFEKAATAGEAQKALALLQEDRQRRNRTGCHQPYSTHLSRKLLLTLQEFGQGAEATSALKQATELGLSLSQSSVGSLLRKLAAAKDFPAMEMVYQRSLLHLEKPSQAMIFTMMKAFAEQQQPEKVLEYAADGEMFGIRLSPAGQALLRSAREQGSTSS